MTDHMKSFIDPLIEEVHAELFSNMTTVGRAPTCKIHSVEESKEFKPSKELFYEMTLKRTDDTEKDIGTYEPEVGDLFALTYVRPRCIDDLDRPTRFHLIAYVYGTKAESSEKLQILASKPILTTLLKNKRENIRENKRESLLAVYIMNMTTNV